MRLSCHESKAWTMRRANPHKVTVEQRRAISKGLKAAKEGRMILAKDADRAIDVWLSKER